ncbi:hypothetical protein AcW1_003271 [Taiwanofungus camphoratus]|nr:hypothetical protein AcV7_005985 [Antrodia cinnamomea]KAI0942714.1 hypothetical protein AcW1_003271 [Antrodia cinnamomea]
MVPAIGGPASIRTKPIFEKGHDFELPPSPVVPEYPKPSFPPFVKTYETDPENLRPGVIDDLSAVVGGWNLDGEHHTQDPNLLGVGESGKDHVDVLDLLKITTRAVRSVRNYLVSLPDESATPMLQTHFRPQSLQSLPPPKRRVSQPDSASEPLSRIRRGALEVLTVLRALEESSRLPLEHDAYDAQSDHGSSPDPSSHSRAASPLSHLDEPGFIDGDTSVSISFIDVGGRQRSVPVWEDEMSAYDVNNLSEEEREKRERWDERLVVGGGWLYRQDIRLADLSRERDVVGRYLDVVDGVLFGGPQGGKRGWERERERAAKKERLERSKGRRVSAGDSQRENPPGSARSGRRVVSTGVLDAMRNMVVTEEPEELESVDEEDSVDDEDLPDWAKRSTFVDNPIGRLHALLIAFLPANLLPLLPPSPTNRSALLQALSSGQLLCIAYNMGVRRSRKPWGFVSKDAIHDIVALEAQSIADAQNGEKGKRGWTFRRTDNLRLWAAALRLRYLLPIVAPAKSDSLKGSITPSNSSTPLASPSASMMRFPSTSNEESIEFNAPLVARLDNGWEDILETVVLKWVDVVVEERRGDR